MRLPRSRGEVSALLIAALTHGDDVPVIDVPVTGTDLLRDADVQLALWMLYELHYRGFDDVVGDREWDPDLIRLRRQLETPFEQAVRTATRSAVAAVPDQGELGDQVLRFVDAAEGPSVAAYLHRHATGDQVLDFLRERSLYHLKESDPQAFVLARLEGTAKTALSELLYDEFGGGRSDRLHATLYAEALAASGLDRTYGAYVDEVSALTLAVNNLMSLFCLNRRLRGAAMGHLAAFEATSSVPCRKIAAGIERVGLPETTAEYFHEHVEADSVHEQLASRDICGSLVLEDPSLREDVLFGAAACLHLDALAGAELLQLWTPEVPA